MPKILYLKKFFVFLLLILLPHLVFGARTPIQQNEYCKYYPVLKNFSLTNAQQCSALIERNCTPINPSAARYVYEKSCIAKILKDKRICDQAVQLAKILNDCAIVDLQIKKVGKFYIVNPFSESIDNYSIITPAGYILSTWLIDPRTFDKRLASKYKNVDFYIENWDRFGPQYHGNMPQSFVVTLKIARSFRIGESIGYAKVKLDFDRNGRLVKIILLKFNKKED